MIKNLFENQGAFTPFAPKYSIPFWNAELLSPYEIQLLSSKILSLEKDIINSNPDLTYDGGTGLGPNSLTAKFPAYNILHWDREGEDFVVRKMRVKIHNAIQEMCEHVGSDIQEEIGRAHV